MMTLTLASTSPRRRELLGLLGLPFEVRASGIDETRRPDEAPLDYVSRVAREKAETISNPSNEIGDWGLVIAADTSVVIDNSEILGKPRDAEEARVMLRKLRGRTHQVISAVAIIDPHRGGRREVICSSDVPMRNYSEAELADYVATGDPLDKAGAYAIQHQGFHPVENFNHCYASVMGLPLCHLTKALRELGVEPPVDTPTECQRFNNYQCQVYQEILG
jgi:septum formation protein